jgi:hypothetical protein
MSRVKVVIKKVMEAGIGDATAAAVSLERDGKIFAARSMVYQTSI